MSRTIQMKRGLLADLPQLLPGEFAFTIDTHEVFIGSAEGNVPMINSEKIAQLELTYEQAAAALEETYAPELANLKASDTSINAQIAAFNQTITNMNRGLGTTMASMAQLLSTYPTGDTKDHIVAGSIAEVDTLTVTTIPTTAGDVTVTLNGVAKTVPVTVGRAEVASLLVTAVPTVAGNVTVTLNGISQTVAIDPAVETTTALVADKIGGTFFSGWVANAVGSTITFTSTTTGAKTDAVYSAGTTGATGTMSTTTQGIAEATTTIVAAAIRAATFTGWTTGGTGSIVTFTATTVGTRTAPTFSGGTTGAAASLARTVVGEAANYHRYFWNGTAWTDGGIYQAIEVQDLSITGSKLALHTVALDRLKSFKPIGIIVGSVTFDIGANTITVDPGTQGWYEDNTGWIGLVHLTDSPDYLTKVHKVSFSGGKVKAIIVDMATKVFTVVDYHVVQAYIQTHRIYGMLYQNRLLGGDRDNAFVTTIKNGANTYKESKLVDKSISGIKIADQTIDGSKIAPSVIGNSHMADLSIGTAELIDNSVTVAKVLNDTLTGRKLAPGSMARNYPLSSNALGYRSRLNDAKNLVWGESIHQLFFNGKHDRYYIRGFWGKHKGNSWRQIEIVSEDGTDSVYFQRAPVYDGEGVFMYPSKEYCVLKDSSNAVRGFAVISWDNTAQVPDYKFVDTEIHASCFINTVKLKDTLNLTFTEDYGVVFHLDSKYYATVGKEFNIYFDAIVATKKPEDIYYSVTASGITYPSLKHFDECIRLLATAGDIGDKTLTIQVKKMSTGETIATASTTLSIRADTPLTTPIKALFLGDSLTAAGTIQNTVKDMFGANFTLYGTRGSGLYLQEGRSSWSTNEYLTIAEKSTTVNPFFNPATSTFDFAYYMANNPTFADVNVVNVFLGRNDGYRGLDTANKIKQIVDNIHAFNPDIIVTVMSAYHTGATNAGTGQYLQNTWGFRQGTFSYNDAAKPVFEGKEAERTFLVPQHVNLDTVYDYPHSNLQVSARNTETVYRITDNVHPNNFGYMKMADVWYNTMQYIRTLITI